MRAPSPGETAATAGLTCALAGLMCLGAAAAPGLLAGAVFLTQCLFLVGWGDGSRWPRPAGGSAVTIAVAGGADILLASGVGDGPGGVQQMAPLAWALAAAVLLSFPAQLGRRDGRPALVVSLAGSLLGTVLVVLGCLVVAVPVDAPSPGAGTASVGCGVLGAALGALVLTLLPGRFAVSPGRAVAGIVTALVIAAAVAAGLAAAGWTSSLGVAAATVAAVAGALGAVLGVVFAAAAGAEPGARLWVAASVPLLLAAPFILFAQRLLAV
jgi:hypothetical protein